jgi:hypothetical protein
VITEAALLYQWGSGEQRRAQVAHLLDAAGRPNVELWLLGFEDGLHPGMCGPINIFEFPGTEPPAVFLETDLAIQHVDGHPDIIAYLDTFTRIRGALRASGPDPWPPEGLACARRHGVYATHADQRGVDTARTGPEPNQRCFLCLRRRSARCAVVRQDAPIPTKGGWIAPAGGGV